MERWAGTCQHELLDRILIGNQAHLPQALHEYENRYNLYRPHRSLGQSISATVRPARSARGSGAISVASPPNHPR